MIKRFVWVLVGIVLLYGVAGFLLLPYIAEKEAEDYIQTHSAAELEIENVSFNPFTFELQIEDLKLTDPYGLEFLKLPHLYLNVDFDAIFQKRIILNVLEIEGLKIQLAHFKDGRMSYGWLTELTGESPVTVAKNVEAAYYYLINAKRIILEQMKVDIASQHVRMASIRVDRPHISVTRATPFAHAALTQEKPEKEETGAWRIDLAHAGIESGVMEFQDFSIPGAAYTVHDNIDIALANISSAAGTTMRYDVALRIDKSGHLAGHGTLQHTPLVHNGMLKIDAIPLKPGSSYLERFTYAKLDKGTFSLDMNVSFAAEENGSELRIDGVHALDGLQLSDTRDGSPLVAFERVEAVPVRFSLKPDALQVGTIRVDGLYANIRRSAEGGLNLATLLKKETRTNTARESVPKEEDAASAGFTATVDQIVLHDNSMDFSDTTPPSPFATSLRKLEGSITGIASDMSGRSRIAMKGVLDTYGTIEVEGDLAAADPKRYTELQVQMRNLDLSSYTPYAVKFVGRKIDAGRLFLDLGYRIENSALKGENGAVIEKMAFGEHVESEGAVSLPLDLAVALLKDRKGVIDVNMPVEGNLDDPDFKYGATVWKAVVNLLSNVATAPFRFLGSLLGIEGERLESVSFAAGSSELLPPAKETLDALSRALGERPGLLLEVAAMYDDKSDRAALQRQKAERLLYADANATAGPSAEALRLEGLLGASMPPEELQNVRAQVQKDHPEPEAFSAYYRDALMARLVTLQNVADSELEGLAESRRKAIATYLEGSGVGAEQIGFGERGATEASGAKWVKIPLGINAIKGVNHE